MNGGGEGTRRLAKGLVALLLVGCGSAAPAPTSFGVNVTLRIGAAVRPQVKSIALRVTGAEQYQKSLDLGAFSGNEARVHYVPGVSSGSLTFSADGLDSSQTVVASGTSGAVTLIAGHAVTAIVDIVGAATTDGGGDGPLDGGSGRDGASDAHPNGKKGDPCTGTAMCQASLTCVDGFCCDTGCNTACAACNLAGREGTCSPVAAGIAPAPGHPACAADAQSTCQHDGACDGAGACRLWPVGTTCRASKCDPTTDAFTPEFKCDGAGFCQDNITIACTPFKCKDTTTCYSMCADSSQCTPGKTCVANSCGLKPIGSICAMGGECANGNCADGVCCDKPCQAGCESCNLPTTRGTCTNVPAGADPKGICAPGTAENAICSPGGCQGTGGTACRRASVTASCRAGTCATGMAVNPATCQANGTCPAVTQTACGVYACGSTSCNVGCTADGDCVSGYYCAANGACQAKKAGGLGCSATTECQAGETCLDGVCCLTASCPACRNCGATGACTVVVASADDTSGSACSGASSCNGSGSCLRVLGQACGSATSCVSNNCVDGVCCSVPNCGACRNCGGTGACNVLVTSTDDGTGTTCTADQSCDATSTCKARWTLVGKVATVEAANSYFTAGAGNYIYFANANNSGGGAQYFKSFNVTTNLFADESKTSNPLCDCGYEGTLVSQPLDNRVYYAANTADSFIAGALAWTPMTTPYPSRGEAATAVLGSRIYYMGGRGALTAPQAYNTTSGAWITTGIAASPVGFSSACAGAFGGVVYVFGSFSGTTMLAYTEATNSWATLNVTPPTGCYYKNLPAWRGKLVTADSALRTFNPTTQAWDPPVPLPANVSNWSPVVAGAANDLFVVGWTGGGTYIYKWVFN